MRTGRFSLLSLTVCAAAILSVCQCLLADTVVKTDGTKVTGKIVDDDGVKIVVETDTGRITVMRSDVLSVEKGLTIRKERPRRGRREEIVQPGIGTVIAEAKPTEGDAEERKKEEAVLGVLNQILGSESDEEKAKLAQGILEGGDETAPYLFVAYDTTKSKELHLLVLDLLSRSKGPEALDIFQVLIHDSRMDPGTRYERILFMRQLGLTTDTDRIPALVRITRVPDRFTTSRAMNALLGIHKAKPDSGVLAAVVAEIKRTIRKGEGKDSELVIMTKMLAEIGDASTPELLVELSRSRDDSLRSTSVWALAKLLSTVSDSLKERDRERCVECLRRGLRDHSARVRALSAEALAAVGGRRAIPDLIELLDDRNDAARSAAHESLKKIVGQDVGKTYEVWMYWWKKQSEAEE